MYWPNSWPSVKQPRRIDTPARYRSRVHLEDPIPLALLNHRTKAAAALNRFVQITRTRPDAPPLLLKASFLNIDRAVSRKTHGLSPRAFVYPLFLRDDFKPPCAGAVIIVLSSVYIRLNGFKEVLNSKMKIQTVLSILIIRIYVQ
ncbi:hypothetical protein EVAR_12888_1 [Eumeta japonica]|uniref:Uncharacterized protein n=1 Tax=Eumeta variegata TaxID=151549 RepID=A0A4C1TVR4_EUMVA|nr:hypothetical protein EVAR_12888_1 [Eumeta japonica]